MAKFNRQTLGFSDFRHLQAVKIQTQNLKMCSYFRLASIHQNQISWRMLKVSPDKTPWSGAWDTAAACRLTRVWTLTMIQHSEMCTASLSPRNVFRRVCILQNIECAASQLLWYMKKNFCKNLSTASGLQICLCVIILANVFLKE